MTERRADDARVRTIFLGSGDFGRESLRRLHEHEAIDLVGVVSTPGSAVQRLAEDLGIERVLTPARLRAPESLADIQELEPEMLVLADYGQIVPAELLGLKHGALNLHPSLLPRHRGATPIPAAILFGDRETGVTLMRMDSGLDTGPIVAVERGPLDGTEIAPQLEADLELVAAYLLERSLGPWIRGELVPRPQASEGAGLTRTLRREDGRIDPRKSAVELERQVRAYQPWPGSFMDTPAGRIVVWSATAEGSGGPGVGTFDERGLGVGDGERLALVEVQPAGGKRMTWEAFLRGKPSIVGSHVLRGP
ncbi:MAG: Methionyl-tRNA formyltransferase [Chloroflexota bacterium]|nr:Methionyl-tRNA formyltransferase [Chloroflexota bacterium]